MKWIYNEIKKHIGDNLISKKLIGKIVVDLAMTIILLILMAYFLIGEVIHECLGTAMMLLFFMHHFLNFG